MKPAFPGMNTYLKSPDLWTEVGSWLIVELARSLNPVLTSKYRAAVEKRVYTETLLVGSPDGLVFSAKELSGLTAATNSILAQPVNVNVPMTEEIQKRYLEIRQVGTGQVVTVIEVLSPKNKRTGAWRDQYNAKQTKIFGSRTHLVEIDLLRDEQPQLVAGDVQSDCRILVSRSEDRPQAELYPFNLRDPVPQFHLPLLSPDDEPVLQLRAMLDAIYEEAALDLAIDYSKQPVPPLRTEDMQWIQQLPSR